jgi:hypothetical protein
VYLLFTDKKPTDIKNTSNTFEKENKIPKEPKIVNNLKENLKQSTDQKVTTAQTLKTQKSMQVLNKISKFESK